MCSERKAQLVNVLLNVFEKLFHPTATNAELLSQGLVEDIQAALDLFRRCYGPVPPDSLVVLIPAFNEEESIADVVSKVPSLVLGMQTWVIVIDDGSTDETAAIAHAAGATVLKINSNTGQGAALKAGYLLALQSGVTYVAVVDGDGQWDPSDLEQMLLPIIEERADFSQGSRKLGSTEVEDRFRNLGVWFFTRLVSLLLGIHVGDTSSGYRAYRSQVLANVRLSQRQYQSSEILISAILGGARLFEHPVKMSSRSGGISKKATNWKYALHYLRAVFQTILRDRYIHPLPLVKRT